MLFLYLRHTESGHRVVIDMMEAEVVSEVEARAGDDCVDCPLRGGFPAHMR